MESMFTRMTSSIISDVMCAQSCVGGENAAAPLTTVSMRPYFSSASFLSFTHVSRCAIGHDRDALAAVGVDLGAELLDLRVDVDHDDLCALLAEKLGRLVADAAGRARDDGHFSFESIHYFVLLSSPSSRR